MTLLIYTVPPSLYCAKLRILLRHKQLDYNEQNPPGGYGSDEFKTIARSGNLPTMVDGELTLTDSESIAEYLNEKCPDPPMLPTDIGCRAKVRELSRFHDTRLEPALRKLFAHIAPANREPLNVQNAGVELQSRIDQHAEMIATNSTFSDQLTLADCGFPISFAWVDALNTPLNLQIKWPLATTQWRERLNRFTAVRVELEQYNPTMNRYIESLISPAN